MEVDNYAVALEIKDCDTKEKRYGSQIQVVETFRLFRVLTVVLEAIANDNEEGKDEEYVGSHRYIGQVLERTQPADGNQNESCDQDVQALHVALVLLGLEADDLVHLLTDKDEVSHAEAKLRCQDIEVNELATGWTQNFTTKLTVIRNRVLALSDCSNLQLHGVDCHKTNQDHEHDTTEDANFLEARRRRKDSDTDE